ncbi:serine/threonine-protein kinase [Anaerotardibacter muris]|uniref:serine/threonine-protein kinase n=1 Tax=Anaerotardibacter muris TaxID=2941505 RepID=UPI0020408219|nr:serine/threonine-protein kinase [Anaerotardibacter muris]
MLILDRYQPTYEAGSGGFATVIVAWDTRIQREVAIKCLPLEDATARTAEQINAGLDNFQNPYAAAGDESVSIMMDVNFASQSAIPGLEEARTAALLNDPNIASIYDFEIQGNAAYIIMELVDGISLSDLLEYFPDQIDADIVAAVFKAVSHAIEVAHKNHVLHLDIKPDNVLINTQGQIKVVDFGLARLADGFGYGAATGGTIGYMPPEQMEREELDERCDQWALASLTYEMLTRGNNPFRAATVDEALDTIYDAEIIIPSLCMEGVDESLDDAIFKALDPDKEGRYASVHAFARDVKPALGNAKQGVKKLAKLVSIAVGEETEANDDTTDFTDTFEDGEDEFEEGPYPLNRRRRGRKSARASQAYSQPLDEETDFDDFANPYDAPASSRYSLVLRILAVLGSVLVSSVALSNFSLLPGWESPALWGAILIVAVAAFAVPHVGALVSFSLLGLALVNNNALLVGVLVVVATFAWWYFIGRGGSEQADSALLSICGSSVGLGSLAPLVSAYFLRPIQALCTTLFAAGISVVLAGLGSVSITSWDIFQFGNIHMWTEVNGNIISTLQNPMTWVIIGSWLVSAPLASALFQRGSTAASIFGIVCATAIICVLPALASAFLLGHDPDPIYLLLTIASGIIMLVVSIFFPPRR